MRTPFPTRKLYLAEYLRKLSGTLGVTLLLLASPYSLPAVAQDVAPKSETDVNALGLLEQLRDADAVEAAKIAKQIKRNWARSGSASADLLFKRGRDALGANKPKVAFEHLTALTDHAPDFSEGWHLRASALYQQELYGPALEDLERALTLNPQHFDAIQGLGAIFEQLGDPKRAYEVYEQVLAIHPHHTTVLEAMERLEADVKGPAL